MFKHSVRIDPRRCVGCTSCIKTCPTEAIRVQQGRAKILSERCIDCGHCITACPHHAMVSVTTSIEALGQFRFNVAVVSSALYAQFKKIVSPEEIYNGLYSLGFDAIYEEGKAAEILAEALRKHIRSIDAVLPVISTNCPVIPRLVCALYPSLIDNLSPFLPTNEIAARIAKEEFSSAADISEADVGVYYISPCAAEMTHVQNPIGMTKSALDGVLSIRDVYAQLVGKLDKSGNNRAVMFRSGAFGLGSSVVGGISSAVGTEHYLAVDGIHAVCQCLEELDNDRLTGLQLIEPVVCSGGCIGGPLNFENQFVAKNRSRRVAYSQPRVDLECDEHVQKYVDSPIIRSDTNFEPNNVIKLSDDVMEAMRMMDRMEEINKSLPGLDCGSCGSPTCRALAEDIVRGYAVEFDCIFKLRDKVRLMAQEMVDLASAQRRG